MGAFHLAEKSFKEKGDENYFAKIAYETYPGMKALITNGLDKTFIIITDPEILRIYFANEKYYVKERFFIENRIRVFGDGVAFAEGKEWAKRRKIMSSIFHYSFF
jgi:cytochrome P450